jgi:hypothetical protein
MASALFRIDNCSYVEKSSAIVERCLLQSSKLQVRQGPSSMKLVNRNYYDRDLKPQSNLDWCVNWNYHFMCGPTWNRNIQKCRLHGTSSCLSSVGNRLSLFHPKRY